jgi:hypothetical protein
MSRHGYVEDCDGDDDNLAWGRHQAQLQSAIRGKRGQAFFLALVEALDALPKKRLAANSLVTKDGEVCALGALARHRAIDVKSLELGDQYTDDPDEGSDWSNDDWDKVAGLFDIAPQLAREVMYENDEACVWPSESPGNARWLKVRAWAIRRLRPETLIGQPEEAKEPLP